MSDKYCIDNFITDKDGNINFALFPFHKFRFSNFSTLKLTSAYEHAPDLVSFYHYRTHSLWWLILHVNGIDRVEDFKTGITIKIPSIQEIDQFIMTLNKGYDK
jgi:hypothetical protein